MNTKQKEELGKFFGDAFREVVLPVLETMNEKILKMGERILNIEENMATHEDIDRLERKVEAGINRMDRHGKWLEDHEERLIVLEKVKN